MNTSPDHQSPSIAPSVITIGVSLVLGILFDYFFFEKVPGLSFLLFVALTVGGIFVIAKFYKRQLTKDTLWLLVPLLFFGTMVVVRSSILLTFLNIVACMLLLLLIAEVTGGNPLRHFTINKYLKIFFLPFKFLSPLLKTLSNALSLRDKTKYQHVAPRVIKGIIITLPILFVFILLFSSADLIFQKYLSNLVSIEIDPETIFRIILITLVTLTYTGAYAYLFRESAQTASTPNTDNRSFGKIENGILLGSINVLFFAFIIIQISYLFGGQETVVAQGFTYAEYARRGFFELIAVAMFSLALLLAIEQSIIKKDIGHTCGFKMLGTALVIQVIVIMGSAFTRLTLYEQAYGFTTLRFYSHAFIIFLAVLFCSLLYKMYRENNEHAFAFRAFIAIVAFLAIMNIANPDAVIARFNINRFAATGEMDAVYLGRLSSDAIPVSIQILDTTNEEIKNSFARELYWRTIEADETYVAQWQSLNMSRAKANAILKARVGELEPYKDYEVISEPLTD